MQRHRIFAGLVLFAFLLTACHKEAPTPDPTALPTASVRVGNVERFNHAAVDRITGRVSSKRKAAIEAKATGRIASMPVVLGQPVEAGDLLVELEAAEIHARFEQAKAAFEQAEREFRRYEALIEKKAVTLQEFDAVTSRRRIAEAALAEARTLLDDAKVRAPFRGVISQKHADVGDLASPGRALLEIEDPDGLRFEAHIPEALIGNIHRGGALQVETSSPPQVLDGIVREIGPSSNPQSRTFLIKLDLPQTEGLRAGQFARVAVPRDQRPIIKIPLRALVRRGQMELVFVAGEQTARMRLVKSGGRIGSDVEILSGLDAGETIVIDGAEALQDGQPLRIEP